MFAEEEMGTVVAGEILSGGAAAEMLGIAGAIIPEVVLPGIAIGYALKELYDLI